MPISKKQLVRLIRLVAQLKENRYPNCTSFAADLRKADVDENLNLACTEKTIYRDIQLLKDDFDAPIKFDKARNGYHLAHHGWTFSCPQIYDDSEMVTAVARECLYFKKIFNSYRIAMSVNEQQLWEYNHELFV